MQKIFTLLKAILMTLAISAQAPEKMSYQAVIRNTEGNLITEQEIGIKISILQGSADGTVVYTETQTPLTNKNGLVSIEIGGEAGFTDIDWSEGPYFIKTETDTERGTNYTITGTSQLLTVPYALHAKTAETISEPIVESDPVFEAHPSSDIEATDIGNWDEAHSWGDHAEEGYLTEEADPVFTAWDKSTGIDITESQISDLQSYLTSITGQSIGDLSDVDLTDIAAGKILKYDAGEEMWVIADDLGITEETDPVFEAHPASDIEAANIGNWDEAYSWGNHAGEGYLTEETQDLADVLSLGNDADGNQIKNLADPTDAQDAATKDYVDKLESKVNELEMILFEAGLHTSKFEDPRDGYVYNIVKIGNQVWMAENLKYLPSVVGPSTGSNTTLYHYVYGYNGTSVSEAKATSNYTTYGVLYNWPAAMNGATSSTANPSGVQGVCPTGWHLPSDAEWTQLTNYLGGLSVAGGKLKETGTTHWSSPNTGATNETGFTALPGGHRADGGGFDYVESHGGWWSATKNDTYDAWHRGMYYDYSGVGRYYYYINIGFSVRCVKDVD